MDTSAKSSGPASYFPSIEKTYGQPIDHWLDILRSAGERLGRTAAARRTADAAQADAALAFDYSHALGKLSGRPLGDTDTGLREIGADLRRAIDGDLSNIGRLRQRYEEQCGSIVAEGETRIEYWRSELDD